MGLISLLPSNISLGNQRVIEDTVSVSEVTHLAPHRRDTKVCGQRVAQAKVRHKHTAWRGDHAYTQCD